MKGRNVMPANAKRVVVTVELRGDDPLDFSVVCKNIPKDGKKFVFKNDHHNGFQIEFELDDKMNLGYLFPPNDIKEEAVWSQLGTVCPDTPCSQVFEVMSVRPDRKTLIVHNPNVDPVLGEFAYTLRLTKTTGAPFLELDPGGVNQNGPVRSRSTAAVFLAGAAVGVLATLGTQTYLMPG